MFPFENNRVDDPPEQQWIDRCALELGRLAPDVDIAVLTESAWEIWRDYRGEYSPEQAAKVVIEDWKDMGHSIV